MEIRIPVSLTTYILSCGGCIFKKGTWRFSSSNDPFNPTNFPVWIWCHSLILNCCDPKNIINNNKSKHLSLSFSLSLSLSLIYLHCPFPLLEEESQKEILDFEEDSGSG
ncbi:hypothetical protein VNO77_16912 [Canavalia gladiata]|uniref:Uncharacterized protein n=1 Tax=Canavalia gladiata TaxID=3824 RepID=A0AAN9LLM8_CANGL